MKQSESLASLKLHMTHTPFLGITISIDQVITEKESIFKFTELHNSTSNQKNINNLWPCTEQVLIMISLEGRIEF